MAVAGYVSSQGNESNNRWCSVAMPSSEVTGSASGSCSLTPSDGGPHPPLESEITAIVCPLPPKDHAKSTLSHLATQKVLHRLLLVAGSWKVTMIKHVGASQSILRWQQQGGSVPREVRATTGGTQLQCPLFLPTSEVTD